MNIGLIDVDGSDVIFVEDGETMEEAIRSTEIRFREDGIPFHRRRGSILVFRRISNDGTAELLEEVA